MSNRHDDKLPDLSTLMTYIRAQLPPVMHRQLDDIRANSVDPERDALGLLVSYRASKVGTR